MLQEEQGRRRIAFFEYPGMMLTDHVIFRGQIYEERRVRRLRRQTMVHRGGGASVVLL